MNIGRFSLVRFQGSVVYRSRALTLLLLISVLSIFSAPQVIAEEELRNPFSGSVSASASQDGSTPESAVNAEPRRYVSPLEKEPLHQYQLLGVILSEYLSLALVQSPLGSHHIVRVGDRIGNRSGSITSILINHILVQEDEKERKLYIGSVAYSNGDLQ